MIAIQKPPNFNMGAAHHRHPSAPPAVVVQPTRTPGLLSLSKPAQQRIQRAKPVQKQKQATPPQQPVAVLKPAAEIKPRGRQQTKPKEKPARSLSHSCRRSNRQPSPPTLPSQAEAPSTPTNDPFLGGPTIVRTAPKLASRPSGKLARRRQPNLVPFELPTPSKAIPVPKRENSTSVLSRSDSFLSHLPPRKSKFKKPSKADGFPVCDDMTDAGDLSDFSLPATPTPSRAKRYDDGPRTAPLTTSTVGFPFRSPPSPLAHKSGRRHKRTPSEGVFQMSSDEDPSSPSSDDVKALFGSQPRTHAVTAAAREEELERQAAAFAAAYFASSTFQNSPSPDELPPPAF